MRAAGMGLLVLATASCGKEGCSGLSGAPPADSSFGIPVGVPLPIASVIAGVNPDKQPRYTGKTGTLRGTVHVEGDAPPDTGLTFPDHCKQQASAAYSKIFRVGANNALADVLVAVTQYGDRGFVPAATDAVKVTAKDCVPDRLTYAVTYGQRLDFFNVDSASTYLPYLDGQGTKAIMVAAPHGPAIKLYPTGPSPSHYMLRDQLGSGLVANVFVLNYATHDVTGMDGRYEIKNLPVGKVRVDALLAVISKSTGKEMQIVEGDNTADFTIHFDAEKDLPHVVHPADAGAKP